MLQQVSVSACLSVCLSVISLSAPCSYLCLSVCLSVSLRLSFCLSASYISNTSLSQLCLPSLLVCLLFHPSVCLSVCLCVCDLSASASPVYPPHLLCAEAVLLLPMRREVGGVVGSRGGRRGYGGRGGGRGGSREGAGVEAGGPSGGPIIDTVIKCYFFMSDCERNS